EDDDEAAWREGVAVAEVVVVM
ncbi:hypothetical protein Tco_1542700, partial [Tanacetum coccineum]